MLKKYCLVLSFLIFIPLFAQAADKRKNFSCYGFYDVYDDTCYFKSGAFVFFGYENGTRTVKKNGQTIRYFFWFNGTPYRNSRYFSTFPFWY